MRDDITIAAQLEYRAHQAKWRNRLRIAVAFVLLDLVLLLPIALLWHAVTGA